MERAFLLSRRLGKFARLTESGRMPGIEVPVRVSHRGPGVVDPRPERVVQHVSIGPGIRKLVLRVTEADGVVHVVGPVSGRVVLVMLAREQRVPLAVEHEVPLVHVPVAPAVSGAEVQVGFVRALVGTEDDADAGKDPTSERGRLRLNPRTVERHDRPAVVRATEGLAAHVEGPAQVRREVVVFESRRGHPFVEVAVRNIGAVGAAGDDAHAVPGIDRRQQVHEVLHVVPDVAPEPVHVRRAQGDVPGEPAHRPVESVGVVAAVLEPAAAGRLVLCELVFGKLAHVSGPSLAHRVIGHERGKVGERLLAADGHVRVTGVIADACGDHVRLGQKVGAESEQRAQLLAVRRGQVRPGEHVIGPELRVSPHVVVSVPGRVERKTEAAPVPQRAANSIDLCRGHRRVAGEAPHLLERGLLSLRQGVEDALEALQVLR